MHKVHCTTHWHAAHMSLCFHACPFSLHFQGRKAKLGGHVALMVLYVQNTLHNLMQLSQCTCANTTPCITRSTTCIAHCKMPFWLRVPLGGFFRLGKSEVPHTNMHWETHIANNMPECMWHCVACMHQLHICTIHGPQHALGLGKVWGKKVEHTQRNGRYSKCMQTPTDTHCTLSLSSSNSTASWWKRQVSIHIHNRKPNNKTRTINSNNN